MNIIFGAISSLQIIIMFIVTRHLTVPVGRRHESLIREIHFQRVRVRKFGAYSALGTENPINSFVGLGTRSKRIIPLIPIRARSDTIAISQREREGPLLPLAVLLFHRVPKHRETSLAKNFSPSWACSRQYQRDIAIFIAGFPNLEVLFSLDLTIIKVK